MFFGHRAAQFDGEVRNAQAGVEALAGDDGGGGAGVHAAHAGSATVGRRLIGGDREGDQDLAQEEPGAHRLVDETGVAADPAEPGQARVAALQQRRGIHADPRLECSGALPQQGGQAFEAGAHHLVVVGAPGVARDPAAFAIGEAGGVRPGGLVELAGDDDAARRGQQEPGVVAQFGAAVGEVAHFAGPSGGGPVLVALAVGGGECGSDARELEAAIAGEGADAGGRQISSPTERMSSMALLLRTTPGRMR